MSTHYLFTKLNYWLITQFWTIYLQGKLLCQSALIYTLDEWACSTSLHLLSNILSTVISILLHWIIYYLLHFLSLLFWHFPFSHWLLFLIKIETDVAYIFIFYILYIIWRVQPHCYYHTIVYSILLLFDYFFNRTWTEMDSTNVNALLLSVCRNHPVTAVTSIRSSLTRNLDCPVPIGPSSTVWTRLCSRTSPLLTPEWLALRTPERHTHTHFTASLHTQKTQKI